MEQKIRAFCEALGLDTVGFIPVRRFKELEGYYKERDEQGLSNEFEESSIERRVDPTLYMENPKTILAIAFPYRDCVDGEVKEEGFSIYTQRGDYHHVVKGYLNQIIAYIESLGGKAVGLVDSHGLPERYIAYLAGIGFIGKNNMLITEKYGSYVFLGEVLMDLEIDCQEVGEWGSIKAYEQCGTCTNCLRSCPTKAIRKDTTNPNVCVSYLTQKKDLEAREIGLLKGRLFGCDSCQSRCPYNETSARTSLHGFETLAYMQEDPRIYAEMDNRYFKDFMSKTSCGWRGKNVIRRNALIAMAHTGEDVSRFKGDSPYINQYVAYFQEQDT